MRFHKELPMAGAFDEVLALLADPSFREQVARQAGAVRVDATVEELDDGALVATLRTAQPTTDMPSMARKLLGTELRVHQEERWTSPGAGTMEVRIPGQPGRVVGTMALEQRGDLTVQTVDADISVKLPFVGSKVEVLIGRILGHLLKVQAAAVSERLEG